MTSPIKPPGGGPPKVGPAAGVDKAGAPDAAKGPKESFGATLDKVSGAEAPQGAAKVDGVQGIVADLKAGKIDPAAAVEQLISRAMESPAAQRLNEAGRAALEAHLRETLQDDPALQSLVDELS